MKRIKKSLAILLATMICLSLISLGSIAAAADVVTIDIYSFNDFHGTVDKSASGSNPGADRFVAILEALMADNPNSVVVSAGDIYQGSPLSNLFYGEPVSDMLKYLGVEFSALGNHEFDWGTEYIGKFVEDGEITFLAANVFYEDTGECPDYCVPYGITEVDGVKIGFIGLTTTEVPSLVKAENVAGLVFADPAEVVAKWEPYLRDEEGCDIVIALTHMGAETEATELAESEAGAKLDAIISGHVHNWCDLEVNGVPIVSAGYNGRGVAVLSFEFDKDAGELVGVTSEVYRQNDMNTDVILPNDPLEVNEEVKAIIAEYQAAAGPLFAKGVGIFGELIASREDQAAWATQVVWDFIYKATGENYVLFQNSGGWRDTGSDPRNPTDVVTMAYLYTLMPFDNEIVLMEMKGSDLLADLLSEEAEVTGYKCIAGAYEDDGVWYLSNGDEILDDDTVYLVACNDFMLTGGDYYNFSNNIGFTFMGVPLRDAMIVELMSRVGIEEQLDPPYMNDLNLEAWYMEAVTYVMENGIMTGTAAFTWQPQLNVNRATAFMTLYKMVGSPAVEGENFNDVAASAWFADAALWAKNTGISEGSSGQFAGARNITRTELAAIFARFLEMSGYVLEAADLSQFNDAGAIPAWAVEQEVIAKIVGSGIISGRSATELAPNATATRAELAQMILNMAEYIDGLDYVAGRVAALIYGGNLSLNIKGSALFDRGFAIGDIVTVKIGDIELDMPICANYNDVDVMDNLVRIGRGSPDSDVVVAVNMSAFALKYAGEVGDIVIFTMKEKGGYLDVIADRPAEEGRTNDREDYASDQVFANFREVTLGDIAPGVFYRSSSPIDPGLGRAAYADKFCEEAGIATVLNFANSDEAIEAFFAADGFDSPYYKGLYDEGQVIALNMGVDFFYDTVNRDKLKEGLEFLLDNEGPFLIHCTEGKDRVGFVAAMIEALMGATIDEIVEDYMQTYVNYFFFEKGSDDYNKFTEFAILPLMCLMADVDKGTDLSTVDLAAAANAYLLGLGLEQSQIDDLVAVLSGEELAAAA